MDFFKHFRKFKWLGLAFVISIGIVVTGCSKSDDVIQKDEKNYNLLNYSGFMSYEPDNAAPMTLVAAVECDSKMGNLQVIDTQILDADEQGITIKYVFFEQADAQTDYLEEVEVIDGVYETHLAHINTKTVSIDKDITIAKDFIGVECDNGNIWYVNDVDGKSEIICYDSSLTQEKHFEIDGEGILGNFTKDGSIYYYTQKSKVYAYDVHSKETTEIQGDKEFLVSSLAGVYTDGAGNDFIFVYGIADDFKDYIAVIDVTNKIFVYIGESTRNISFKNNNVISLDSSGDSEYIYTVAGSGNIYDYVSDNFSTEILPLEDGRICICNTDETILNIALYDAVSGNLTAQCRKEITLWKDDGEAANDFLNENVEYGDGDQYGGIYVYGTPVILSDGKILLTIVDENYIYYYIWNTQVSDYNTIPADIVSVSVHELPEKMIADTELDFTKYQPSELDEKLQPLRKKADDLEKKYNVEIHIGQECSNIIGNYAMEALTDYDAVEESLDILDYEMAKYPDNFFAQFVCDEMSGLDIYITGSIRLADMNEEGIDSPGGFRTEYDGRMLLVVDCILPESLRSTFHHELCHSIEALIDYKSDDELYFSDDRWNELNPFSDIYTLDYSKFGTEDTYKYTFEEQGYENVSEVYFIDSYSLTYGVEDRATIFENVMCDDAWIDYDNLPHIKDKLNYFAWCMREVFDTTGWENVMWEKYL